MPITAPTFTIDDIASNGGFTATLTGGDSGATNTLYAARYTNALASSTWVSQGSRTGPGTISGTHASGAGYYLWYVKSVLLTDVDISPIVNQPLTDGEDALHEQIIDAVQATVELLALPGITTVYRRKVTWADLMMEQLEFPAVVVSTFEQTDTPLGGTNAMNDRGLPVYVMFMSTDARENENEARWHLWRQMIWRTFHNCRLAAVPDVLNCEVQAAQVILADERKMDLQFGGFQIMAHTREPKGFGA